MTCHGVKLPGGGSAIICTGRRPRKCKCGTTATLLCDWKVKTKRSGTCDQPICERCATHPTMNGRTDFDKDLCPAHAAEFEQWKDARR